MEPGIRRQLGVEHRGQQPALSGHDHRALGPLGHVGGEGGLGELGEDLHPGGDIGDHGRPDEHGVEGLGANGGDGDIGPEGVDLAPKKVPVHRDVHDIEQLLPANLGVGGMLGQEDGARTGTLENHRRGKLYPTWPFFNRKSESRNGYPDRLAQPDPLPQLLQDAVPLGHQRHGGALSARDDQRVEVGVIQLGFLANLPNEEKVTIIQLRIQHDPESK